MWRYLSMLLLFRELEVCGSSNSKWDLQIMSLKMRCAKNNQHVKHPKVGGLGKLDALRLKPYKPTSWQTVQHWDGCPNIRFKLLYTMYTIIVYEELTCCFSWSLSSHSSLLPSFLHIVEVLDALNNLVKLTTLNQQHVNF